LITDVDPLPYGLLFERFLNPARVSMPDFDVDFEDTLRDKVIEYVIEHYGSNKVAAIGTYMQMTTKAAFKDAARAVGMPFDKANTVSNVIQADSFDEIMSHPNQHEEFLIHYNNDNIVKRAVDFAIILERNLRQV
jgi:DNA polymerase-3 subunit alpha